MLNSSNETGFGFAPRGLSEGEREVLANWALATESFVAFVSERRNDDPSIYRRIVVADRPSRQPRYLLHCPLASNWWIMLAAANKEQVGNFPTLRAALEFISRVPALV